jgi:hypothetical protein
VEVVEATRQQQVALRVEAVAGVALGLLTELVVVVVLLTPLALFR